MVYLVMLPRLRTDIPTLALICVTLWVLGSVSSYTLGGLLHLFLVAAVGMMLWRIVRGRKAVN
jgi:hypothetical protein